MISPNTRIVSAYAFTRAARRYWLSVFPSFLYELRRWQSRARQIEDPVLRQLALDAQRAKRRSLEGAVAFAAFVPRSAQRTVVTALATYQVIFDYLDTLAEQPNVDPIRNGRQLNQALLSALDPGGTRFDYYAHHCRGGDRGYLDALIDACRAALFKLPSYAAVLAPVRRAAERIVTYQSLNHGDANRSHDAFERWADATTQPATGLRWWETGAAAGSSLGVLALISATADPTLTERDTEALDDAYYPWIGALHTLLDSLVDRKEDATVPGQRSLLDYYNSPAETAARLEMIARQAVRRATRLPHARSHAMILAAMASLYLSEPQASTPDARMAKQRVLSAIGGLAAPSMAVLKARRAASLLHARPHRGKPGRILTLDDPLLETQVLDFPLVGTGS
jgi:tetraprenyl-beta-curcumene synthase